MVAALLCFLESTMKVLRKVGFQFKSRHLREGCTPIRDEAQ